MATHSPEGGNPYNIDPKTVRVAREQRRFGSGFQKPTESQLTREQLLAQAGGNIVEWLAQKHQKFVEEQIRLSRQREEKSPEPTTDQEE